MEIKVKRLTDTAVLPKFGKPGDAGADLTLDAWEYNEARHQIICSSGISIEVPEGWFADLRCRSSICKKDLRLTNAVGTIDSGYRGDVIAVFDVITPKGELPDIERIYQCGERFAQLVILPKVDIQYVEADELTTTERGEGGYGSTGK